jgi:SAM-dependent methyltransferase
MTLPPRDWDARFAGADYLFGKEPAAFVPQVLPLVPGGSRVLSLADGEGRNAVALARAGHQVVAMEASATALSKARRLAEERGVTVEFVQARIEDWDWTEAEFGAVAGIFIQFAPPALRAAIHAGIARTLRPGGLGCCMAMPRARSPMARAGPRQWKTCTRWTCFARISPAGARFWPATMTPRSPRAPAMSDGPPWWISSRANPEGAISGHNQRAQPLRAIRGPWAGVGSPWKSRGPKKVAARPRGAPRLGFGGSV